VLADTEMADGHPVITGLVMSVTITLNVQLAVLPAASVAVYVTGVVPKGKREPEACELVKVETEQLSDAVGAVQVAVAWHDELAEREMFDGQPVMTGLLLSTTMTLKVQVDDRPDASVAVYVTGVVPIEKRKPEACVLIRVETTQLSDAVGGVHVATALQDAFAVTKISVGHPIIRGFVLSVTVTLNAQIFVLPDASVAV
jgi:hypothetical protein